MKTKTPAWEWFKESAFYLRCYYRTRHPEFIRATGRSILKGFMRMGGLI